MRRRRLAMVLSLWLNTPWASVTLRTTASGEIVRIRAENCSMAAGVTHTSIVTASLALAALISFAAGPVEAIGVKPVTSRLPLPQRTCEGFFTVRSSGLPTPATSCTTPPVPSWKSYSACKPVVTRPVASPSFHNSIPVRPSSAAKKSVVFTTRNGT